MVDTTVTLPIIRRLGPGDETGLINHAFIEKLEELTAWLV